MGNWNREGVPRKGWQCMDVFDLAEEAEQDEDMSSVRCVEMKKSGMFI